MHERDPNKDGRRQRLRQPTMLCLGSYVAFHALYQVPLTFTRAQIA